MLNRPSRFLYLSWVTLLAVCFVASTLHGRPTQTRSRESKKSVGIDVTKALDSEENGVNNGAIPGRLTTEVKTVGGTTVICGNLKDALGKLILPQTCVATGAGPSPTPTPTTTPTATPPPPATPTPTPTATATATPTPTATPTATPTPTVSSSPSPTPTPSITNVGTNVSAISIDGKRIYFHDPNRGVFSFDIATGTEIRVPLPGPRGIYASPDGRNIVFAYCEELVVMDRNTHVFEPSARTPYANLPGACPPAGRGYDLHTYNPQVQFSPDGSILVAGRHPIDVQRKKAIRIDEAFEYMARDSTVHTAFSPDGSTAYGLNLFIAKPASARLFSVNLKKAFDTFDIHSPVPVPLNWLGSTAATKIDPNSIALDPSGTKLYFAGLYGGIGVMNLKTQIIKPIDTSKYPKFGILSDPKKDPYWTRLPRVTFLPIRADKIYAYARCEEDISHCAIELIAIDPVTDSIILQNSFDHGAGGRYEQAFTRLSNDGKKAFPFQNRTDRFIRLDTLSYESAIAHCPPELAKLSEEKVPRPIGGFDYARRRVASIPSPDGKQYYILFDDRNLVTCPIP